MGFSLGGILLAFDAGLRLYIFLKKADSVRLWEVSAGVEERCFIGY